MTTPAQPRRLTDAQRRALLWLAPGQDCPSERHMALAMRSLAVHHPDLVKNQLGFTIMGRIFRAFSLTALGVELRAELMRQDAERGV